MPGQFFIVTFDAELFRRMPIVLPAVPLFVMLYPLQSKTRFGAPIFTHASAPPMRISDASFGAPEKLFVIVYDEFTIGQLSTKVANEIPENKITNIAIRKNMLKGFIIFD